MLSTFFLTRLKLWLSMNTTYTIKGTLHWRARAQHVDSVRIVELKVLLNQPVCIGGHIDTNVV